MKYALVDNTKLEAAIGLKGTCPVCGSELIAKCGEVKINHWAHKGARNCDLWWEPETEWHRAWKNNFSADWQEIVLTDEETGEKHIADVRTAHGLVIEFQHSHINPNERRSREKFYKPMVWVVDGTRLEKDYDRFFKGRVPSTWVESSVPVVFDFKGLQTIRYASDPKFSLYVFFSSSISKDGKPKIIRISCDFFIKNVINGEWFKQQDPEPSNQTAKPPVKTIQVPRLTKRRRL